MITQSGETKRNIWEWDEANTFWKQPNRSIHNLTWAE